MFVIRNCGLMVTGDTISGSCTSNSKHDWYIWACMPHMFVSIRHACMWTDGVRMHTCMQA